MSSPVAGFLPLLSRFSLTQNFPKPLIRTFSPDTSLDLMIAMTQNGYEMTNWCESVISSGLDGCHNEILRKGFWAIRDEGSTTYTGAICQKDKLPSRRTPDLDDHGIVGRVRINQEQICVIYFLKLERYYHIAYLWKLIATEFS